MMNLHNEIMNIQAKIILDGPEGVGNVSNNRYTAYKEGHRDARHAAAELALKAEARIEGLELACKVHADDCNEAEAILREIIKEWSCSGDVFGAIMKAKEFLK